MRRLLKYCVSMKISCSALAIASVKRRSTSRIAGSLARGSVRLSASVVAPRGSAPRGS
jgi:hypothetical protein